MSTLSSSFHSSFVSFILDLIRLLNFVLPSSSLSFVSSVLRIFRPSSPSSFASFVLRLLRPSSTSSPWSFVSSFLRLLCSSSALSLHLLHLIRASSSLSFIFFVSFVSFVLCLHRLLHFLASFVLIPESQRNSNNLEESRKICNNLKEPVGNSNDLFFSSYSFFSEFIDIVQYNQWRFRKNLKESKNLQKSKQIWKNLEEFGRVCRDPNRKEKTEKILRNPDPE